MGLQPTASKTELLLQCPRPFAPDTAIEPQEAAGEAARYGSAFHELMYIRAEARALDAETCAAVAGRWDVAEHADELYTHVNRAWAVLQDWLTEGGWSITSAEQPMAWRPGRLRATTLDLKSHQYALEPGEIGLTADLVAKRRPDTLTRRRVVIDYKTGADPTGSFATPSRIPQMRTLATALDADDVAILHAPRGGLPIMFSEPTDAAYEGDYGRHAEQLQAALAAAGAGYMRPGAHCNRCPAQDGCPARDSHLLDRAEAQLQALAVIPSKNLLGAVNRGKLHQLRGELLRLLDRVQDELKAEVKGGAVIERPDGKVLAVVVKEVERIMGKSDIVSFLGRERGEALLEELRRLGVLRVCEQEELRAVKGGA